MLAGTTVLDLSRVLAGPYCTMLLADLGARVIKIEPPGGEDTRRWGPPFVGGESAYYLAVNRGKQSVAVNLKDARGRAAVRALAARADVLVENFKTGDLARYGLDYPTLAAENPRLIYASITGFGHDGPRAAEPGYDAALQALSGLMAMTGEPDGSPLKLGVAWIDVLTGLHAATGILAALHERGRSGRGRRLDLALFDVALASMVNQAQSTLLTGSAPERLGSAHPNIVPYRAFESADHPLVIAVGNDAQFVRLCEALALPALADDPRFADNAGRVAGRDALEGALQRRLRERPRAEWIERLRAAGVPATPVSTLAEALRDPQTAARGLVATVEHPSAGTLPLVTSPFAHPDPAAVRPPSPPRCWESTPPRCWRATSATATIRSPI
jgi:crotonobetainyl-CoA:carnitine CoA-transferase CaiB-like acyl-CoA transferase